MAREIKVIINPNGDAQELTRIYVERDDKAFKKFVSEHFPPKTEKVEAESDGVKAVKEAVK